MSNTPNSILQIDNILEHIKRSASKAMDTDWITTESLTSNCQTTSTSPPTAVASFNHYASSATLNKTRTRSSCFDISQLGSSTGNRVRFFYLI